MKAVGYVRLSGKDQSRYSLEVQKVVIENYCIKNQLDLVAMFTDNGQSSSSFNRLDFKALEAYLKRNKKGISYLIIVDHDRFSRDLKEALYKISTLEKDYGVKVLAVDEPLDLDVEDSHVILNRGVKYLVANLELLRIRDRTKNTIKGARLAGKYINKAPFGYRNGKDSLGKGLLTIYEEQAMIVRQIFHYYLLGIPIHQIKIRAKEIGFPNKSHSAIQRVLCNCVYAGLIKINDEKKVTYVKAIHEAIVTESDFWLVQKSLSKGNTKVKMSKEFPLKQQLKCCCGKYMTAAWSKGKKKHYLYYRCYVHPNLNVPGMKVHSQLEHLLECLSFSDEQKAFLSQKVSGRLTIQASEQEQRVAMRLQTVNEINRKIENLEESFINRQIDEVMFNKWLDRFRQDRIRLEDQVNELKQEIQERQVRLQLYLSRLDDLYGIYQNSNPVQKQLLLNHAFPCGFIYANEKLQASCVSVMFAMEVNSASEREVNADDIKGGSESLSKDSLEYREGIFFELLSEIIAGEV